MNSDGNAAQELTDLTHVPPPGIVAKELFDMVQDADPAVLKTVLLEVNDFVASLYQKPPTKPLEQCNPLSISVIRGLMGQGLPYSKINTALIALNHLVEENRGVQYKKPVQAAKDLLTEPHYKITEPYS
jgi:hypothetical protein